MLALPTIACITGHCIAGGAFLASVMDFRLMRADKGWFAFTEIDVKIPPSPKLYLMADLLPNKKAVRELLLTGKKVGGDDGHPISVKNYAIIFKMYTIIELDNEISKMILFFLFYLNFFYCSVT